MKKSWIFFLLKYLNLSFKKMCKKFHRFFKTAAVAAADNSDILNCTFLEAKYILNIPNTYEGGIWGKNLEQK